MNRALLTDRLDLRPFTLGDADGWHAIWGDPEVIWWGAFADAATSRAALERLVAAERDWPDGVGWLAARLRGEEVVVGNVLLQPAKFIDGIEIGWHFRTAWQGCGLATEAARAVMERAFHEDGIPAVFAVVDPSNAPSLRVAEKLGLRRSGTVPYDGEPFVLFAGRPAPTGDGRADAPSA